MCRNSIKPHEYKRKTTYKNDTKTNNLTLYLWSKKIKTKKKQKPLKTKQKTNKRDTFSTKQTN